MSAESDLAAALASTRRDRERFLALVASLSPDDFERARRGGWSIRRVLHHVIESEATYAKLLAHLRGRAAPDLAARTPVDGADATRQLATTRDAVQAIVDRIDGATLYRLARIGHEEYSPLSVLENIALHDREHHEQIEHLLTLRDDTRPEGEVEPLRVTVRDAGDFDLPRVTEIYNHYVVTSSATFDLTPFTVEQRREWFAHYSTSGPHRLLVAERDGLVLGYAASGRFRTKPAYDTTVETTVYCAPEATSRGVGSQLYAALFEALRGEDLHVAVAGITLTNDASCALHERFGFVRAGMMPEVGRKFGRFWDVVWYVTRLDDRSAHTEAP